MCWLKQTENPFHIWARVGCAGRHHWRLELEIPHQFSFLVRWVAWALHPTMPTMQLTSSPTFHLEQTTTTKSDNKKPNRCLSFIKAASTARSTVPSTGEARGAGWLSPWLLLRVQWWVLGDWLPCLQVLSGLGWTPGDAPFPCQAGFSLH